MGAPQEVNKDHRDGIVVMAGKRQKPKVAAVTKIEPFKSLSHDWRVQSIGENQCGEEAVEDSSCERDKATNNVHKNKRLVVEREAPGVGDVQPVVILKEETSNTGLDEHEIDCDSERGQEVGQENIFPDKLADRLEAKEGFQKTKMIVTTRFMKGPIKA